MGFPALPAGFRTSAFSRACAFADLNRDGMVDYLMTGDHGRKAAKDPLYIYLGQGNARWRKGPVLEVLKEAGAIPADINGDGFLDLLVSQTAVTTPRGEAS